MKKLIIFMAMAIFGMLKLDAQELGIRTGWTGSSAKVDALNSLNIENEKMSGFHIGAFTEIPLGYGLFFQPELTYTQMGFGANESIDINLFGLDIPAGAKVETRVNYIQAPLQLKYYLNRTGVVQPFVHLGPTIGYGTSAELRASANFILNFNITQQDINMSSDNINRWEIGATGGAGLRFDMPSKVDMIVGANYYHAFNNWLNDPIIDADIFNRSTQIYLGTVIDL